MGEGNVFSLFTSGGGGGQSSRGGGGVSRASGGGGLSSQWGEGGGQSSQWGGSVQPAGGGGGVSPASRGGARQGGVSQDRNYYTAGGMPLAFTQEDFLVIFVYSLRSCQQKNKLRVYTK